MNIIFDSLFKNGTEEGFDVIAEHYADSELYVFFLGAEEEARKLRTKYRNIADIYLGADLHAGTYETYRYFDECPPLDESILRAMSDFDFRILKNLERNLLPNFEDRVRRYRNQLKYWNYALDAIKVDLVIFTGWPHITAQYVIYALCKIKGIKHIEHFGGPRLDPVIIHTDYTNPFPDIVNHYEELSKQLKDTTIEDIIIENKSLAYDFDFYSNSNNDLTPAYFKASIEKEKKHRIFKRLAQPFSSVFSLIAKSLKYYDKPPYEDYLEQISTYLYLKAWRIRYQKAHKKLFEEADYSKKYIYYPLHYQYEGSTDPLAGVYVHQELAIEMLSHYLPDDVYLYVKEHPAQNAVPAQRNVRIYYDIAKMKNVKLISAEQDTFKLIYNAIAIATCTGTVAIEALFKGKPVLMFGYQALMYFPGVFQVRTNEDCKSAIDYILTHGARHTLKDLKIYFKAFDYLTKNTRAFNHINAFHASLYGVDSSGDYDSIRRAYVKAIDATKRCT